MIGPPRVAPKVLSTVEMNHRSPAPVFVNVPVPITFEPSRIVLEPGTLTVVCPARVVKLVSVPPPGPASSVLPSLNCNA
jgi:hypothetical protein